MLALVHRAIRKEAVVLLGRRHDRVAERERQFGRAWNTRPSPKSSIMAADSKAAG
jgi:hypothetical protein